MKVMTVYRPPSTVHRKTIAYRPRCVICSALSVDGGRWTQCLQ